MATLWYWTVSSIAGSILGSAFSNWFFTTGTGIWFNMKVQAIMEWAVERYNLEILKTESKFKQAYPTMYARIVELEKRLDITPK